MRDLVLLHGAFRGPWAWDRVITRLKPARRVVAIDLTSPAATLDSCIDLVAATIKTHDMRDVVLVGHSQGGFIAKAASQRAAPRLGHLLYLDAPVPCHGQTAFDFRPAGTPAPPFVAGDLVDPFPVQAGNGVSTADADWINTRLVPQAVAPSLAPVELTDPTALALPETYVFFTRSSPALPCAITRAELDALGQAYELVDAPHDAPVTHADVVAALIERLASD